MKRYALIGKRLGHSWSQQWFEALFQQLGLNDHSYTLCEMPTLEGLRRWVEAEHIDGFNVTIPYKQAILPLLDALSPEAEAIGAVNCVVVRDGQLTGHNTDAAAFRQTLKECGVRSAELGVYQNSELRTNHSELRTQNSELRTQNSELRTNHSELRTQNSELRTQNSELRIQNSEFRTQNSELRTQNSSLILGTGGAAHAVAYALKELGIDYLHVSRNPTGSAIGYAEAAALRQEFGILVNATPVGMWPDVEATPWPYSLEGFQLVYDLIYNPSPTLLMRQARERSVTAVDGLAMLHRQAELSWQLWQQ